jgi:hypothetical protein
MLFRAASSGMVSEQRSMDKKALIQVAQTTQESLEFVNGEFMKKFMALAVLLISSQANLASAATCVELEKIAKNDMDLAYKNIQDFKEDFNTTLIPWCKKLDSEKECGELRLVFDRYYHADQMRYWDETNFKMGYVPLLQKILPHMNGSPSEPYDFDAHINTLFKLHYAANLAVHSAGMIRHLIDQHQCD